MLAVHRTLAVAVLAVTALAFLVGGFVYWRRLRGDHLLHLPRLAGAAWRHLPLVDTQSDRLLRRGPVDRRRPGRLFLAGRLRSRRARVLRCPRALRLLHVPNLARRALLRRLTLGT